MSLIAAWDTETTGLDDPELVEVGVVLLDDRDDWRERACVSLIVRPSRAIEPGAVAAHGITDEVAAACGVPLVVAVAAMSNLFAAAQVRVAHNAEFDERVIARAVASLGRSSTVRWPPLACTKDLATPILDLPPTARMLAAGYDKPKPPSLTEAHVHFYGVEFDGAHGALADARAVGRVFRAIREKRGKHA